MSTEAKATWIFEQVRTRYKSSLTGSSNKKYDLDAAVFVDAPAEVLIKRGMRNLKAELAQKRGHQEGKRVNAAAYTDPQADLSGDAMQGKQLWNLNVQKLNCEELAKICCWKATEAVIPAYLAAFDPPGDHAVCIVGQANTKPLDLLKNSVSIKDYKGKTGSSDAWIIDVWLNTACHIADYPEQASAKLDEWSKKGKRVTFFPVGQDDEIWGAPGGDYKTIFMGATMSWG